MRRLGFGGDVEIAERWGFGEKRNLRGEFWSVSTWSEKVDFDHDGFVRVWRNW